MQKILVIKPSSLGDIVHGLQVMAALKSQRADVHISWVTRDMFAPFVSACDLVDQIYVFRRGAGLKAFVALLRELRTQHFDWVLDMQGLARSGLMTYLSHAREKVGRADARECSSLAYRKTIALPATGRNSHAVEILLQFLPVLGLAPNACGRLTFSLDRDKRTVDIGQNAILVFPSSRRIEKDWPGYAGLTERMFERLPQSTVCWVGQQRCEHPGAWDALNFRNFTGTTGLLELVHMVAHAQLIVSNDSGPMHLAAAMGTPLVAVFGPTDPRRFGPYPLSNPQHRVVQAPLGDFSRLSVDEVLQAIENSV